MKVSGIDSKLGQRLLKLMPLIIFLMALAIRLYYDLVVSQQRLCHFGDAYFFLKTGQEIARALTSASSPSDLFAQLTVHTSTLAGGLESFGSGALGDRLLLDGPVFTSYLALVQILTNIVSATDFAANTQIYSIANSIVDSISCVLVYLCGRLAFNRATGAIAGTIWAFYPGAVLNTRLCYSDPFSYFLLLSWTALALFLYRCDTETRSITRLSAALFLGIFSVLVLLAKSIFLPLMFVLLCILIGGKLKLGRTAYSSLLAFAAGAAIIMTPWLCVTHGVTGKLMPWVNRAPGYNLFVGNQLATDGWRTWPAQEGIATETSLAMRSVFTNFASDPLRFTALTLRKESRLWAGVWSDFQHKYLRLNWAEQNVFHDLILLLGLSGFLLSLRPPVEGQVESRRPALILALLVVYHGLYALFEPVARYAVTAMPFASLLAACALVAIPKPYLSFRFWSLLIAGGCFFKVLDSHFSFVPLLNSFMPLTPAYVLDGVFWFACWMLLALLVKRVLSVAGNCSVLQTGITFGAALICAVVSLSSQVYDPAKREWSTTLRSEKDEIVVDMNVPAMKGTAPISFVLVDMQAASPNVRLTVNNVEAGPPLPFLQMTGRADAAELFALQAQPMARDPRSFRHWWAFPVPTACIESKNKIKLTTVQEPGCLKKSVSVFGDYPLAKDGENDLPSIIRFSWVKGFVTIDRRDPRTYERLKTEGAIESCSFKHQGETNTTDLSSHQGKQDGAFRVRLYVPGEGGTNVDPALFRKQEVVFQRAEESLIAGGDPNTMIINKTPILFNSKPTDSSFYQFKCQLQPQKGRMIGAVSITFTGEDGGKEIKWSSPWCPTVQVLERDGWQQFSFLERIPKQFQTAKNLAANILISPFPTDRLYLHKKKALRDSVKVRNIELSYFPSYAPLVERVAEGRLY